MCASLLMIVILYLLKFIVPLYSTNRIFNIFIILFYSLIGIIVYFIYSLKTKTIKNIFGNKLFKKKK